MPGAPVASPATARELILRLAVDEGFPLVRFASAQLLNEARTAAQGARKDGRLADMGWMTREWIDRSTDPERFLACARTVVLLALPYAGAVPGSNSDDGLARGRIARYARGRDYHRVFEQKLRRIAAHLREDLGASARATVDYGPLLERPLAAAAGMGWLGKSTMLLAPGFGPWVLLGAIATDLEVAPDPPLRKSCGACRRCIVACPTGAITPDGGAVDARLCISYHTIENRGVIPRELRSKFGAWIFGCDECLDSCPVGTGATASYPDFLPRSVEDAEPELAPLLKLDEGAFVARFRGRAVMRAKRDGFVRNVCVALGNVGQGGDLAALFGALEDQSALVRGHAAWAIARLVARLDDAGPLDAEPACAEAIVALENALANEQDHWVREELGLAIAEIAPRF